MKIKSLQLKNFKRFTDLTLQDIPESAKLVLLIGSNGSGKSSVFDAFEEMTRAIKGPPAAGSHELNYTKNKSIHSDIIAEFHNPYYKFQQVRGNIYRGGLTHNSFYGRTSFRQIPRLQRYSLGQGAHVPSDSDRPSSFIERDERFENDLEHLFGQLLKEFFQTTDDKGEIKNKVINPINAALKRIFSDGSTTIQLREMIPPLAGRTAELNFVKGQTVFHYNYLSAGEKEVVNILINLIARREYFPKSIYFFDEIDLHLNTKLQFNLLKEIVENWIPEDSQFWTASHSLGFIDYAKQSDSAVIFDFDDLDFDYPKTLLPLPKDNPDVYEIAVSKELLPRLFRNFDIYFVENQDERYYAQLGFERTIFPVAANKYAVFQNNVTTSYKGIIDRDFLSDDDIELITREYKGLHILHFYCIECYLFHPRNLQEYYRNDNIFDYEDYVDQLVQVKKVVTIELSLKITTSRLEYPFFKEPKFEKTGHRKRFLNTQENQTEAKKIMGYLQSDDPDSFLKVLSLKDYGTQISYRQNIAPTDLAKTHWFKEQIASIINKKG
jgi:energy-coupling factor transporter ATP-binding protein EcfA2